MDGVNYEKINLLTFRRELQNMALNINNYTQEELQNILFRAIEIIDELRSEKETIEAMRHYFTEKLLDEAKIKIMEDKASKEASIEERIRSLESHVYNI